MQFYVFYHLLFLLCLPRCPRHQQRLQRPGEAHRQRAAKPGAAGFVVPQFKLVVVVPGRVDAVGQQRMQPEEHHQAAADLDQVGDEHHAALGHRIGKRADERGQCHVGHEEEQLEHRRHPLRRVDVAQQRDGGDEQRVVGERRAELRGHDRVEAAFHQSDVSSRNSSMAGKAR